MACGGTPAFKAPAGWALHKLVDLAQGSQAGAASLPLIALLTNAAAGQLAVIIRGTSTAYEWTLDFEYNQARRRGGRVGGSVGWVDSAHPKQRNAVAHTPSSAPSPPPMQANWGR